MPPELQTHLYWEIGALVFAAGGGWWMLNQMRREVRTLWKKHDEEHNRNEARYRKTLVMCTTIASYLPDNPGSRQKVHEMIQRLADENGDPGAS